MNLSVIAPPPAEPVTIAQAFAELRLGGPDDDPKDHPDYSAVLGKLRAATQDCENYTGRAFVQQTLRLSGSRWMWEAHSYASRDRSLVSHVPMHGLPMIGLLRPPVISIAAVSYYNAANVLTVVDPVNYYTPDTSAPSLSFAAGYALPSLYDRPDALRIDYVAGYPPGTPDADYDPEDPPQHLAANVPHPIRQAVLLTLRMMYDDMRPEDRAATQRARDALLWPYKVLRV